MSEVLYYVLLPVIKVYGANNRLCKLALLGGLNQYLHAFTSVFGDALASLLQTVVGGRHANGFAK